MSFHGKSVNRNIDCNKMKFISIDYFHSDLNELKFHVAYINYNINFKTG